LFFAFICHVFIRWCFYALYLNPYKVYIKWDKKANRLTVWLGCARLNPNLRPMRTRDAHSGDWLAIETLIQEAERSLPRLWCWEHYLGRKAPFVVIEHQGRVVGALFAWADASPVAWARMAVLDDALGLETWFDLALPPLLDQLSELGIDVLAWMDHGGWAAPALETRGFTPLVKVITLSTQDDLAPDVTDSVARVRPAVEEDFGAIASIDRAAFAPYWWRSPETLRRRAQKGLRFTVAERTGMVVGYTESQLHLPSSHLNRIAVHPACQGEGVGALLLQAALCDLWRNAVEEVALNTQRDNWRARRLYRRFGFEPTGDSMTVWKLDF
jgi:ribosomal-protein-alanine N-acetyltransferase